MVAYDSSESLYPEYAKIQISYAWDGKGDALNQTGRYEESVMSYDSAIEYSSPEFEMYRSTISAKKGDVLERTGRHEEALEAFDKAIEITPEYAPAWQGKGRALKALGRSWEAEEAFARSKELEVQG